MVQSLRELQPPVQFHRHEDEGGGVTGRLEIREKGLSFARREFLDRFEEHQPAGSEHGRLAGARENLGGIALIGEEQVVVERLQSPVLRGMPASFRPPAGAPQDGRLERVHHLIPQIVLLA